MREMLSVFVALTLFCSFSNINSNASVDELCNELLPNNYKIYEAPENQGKPINVFIGFEVLDIGEIDEEKMDFLLHVYINSIWNDTRLKLDSYKGAAGATIVYDRCRKYIWTPDIFFETAKRVETFENTSPSTLIKVLTDGAVFMSTRYSFTVACNMNLKNYPFDTQKCSFPVALMYSADTIAVLIWVEDNISPYRHQMTSIKMTRKVQALQFHFKMPTTSSVTEAFAEGNYTSLIAEFRLMRLLTGSIMNTYAPSTMIVTMSWVSFWLKVDAVPARVALSITSLLTLCTQVQQYKAQLPPVSYLKAMDIWLFMCIIMVFSTLLEFAVSYNIHKKKCSKCQTANQNITSSKADEEDVSDDKPETIANTWVTKEKKEKLIHANSTNTTSPSQALINNVCSTCLEYSLLGHKIDVLCRNIFPGSFIIFAITYWVYYLKIYNSDS